MSKSFLKNPSIVSGVVLVAIFAILATLISKIGFVKHLGFSPLVIGIVLGIIYANVFHHKRQSICKVV